MCSLNAHLGILVEKQRGHKPSFQLVVDPSVEVANVPVLQFGLGIDAVQLLVLCSQLTPHVLSHAHQLVQSLVSDPGEGRGGEGGVEDVELPIAVTTTTDTTSSQKSTN